MGRAVYVDFGSMVQLPIDAAGGGGDGAAAGGGWRRVRREIPSRPAEPEPPAAAAAEPAFGERGGQEHAGWSEFVEHFASLIWFTYREGFRSANAWHCRSAAPRSRCCGRFNRDGERAPAD